MRIRPTHTLFLLFLFVRPTFADDPIQVLIWDEQQPSQREAYPSFLGKYIADYLKRQPGLVVNSVSIDHPQKGLAPELLDKCDVLVWWGHVRNREVSFEEARPVVDRIKQGKLSMLALHSAHWATPFVLAMHDRTEEDALKMLGKNLREKATTKFVGDYQRKAPKRSVRKTPYVSIRKQGDGLLLELARQNCCFPAYRNDGKPSEMTTVLTEHPIARDIPKQFTLPHTEMYDEPFHVPDPDSVVFEERWKTGERFRSGMVWNFGKGKIVYFRPGHETHAVYTEKVPMKIVENTIRWLGK